MIAIIVINKKKYPINIGLINKASQNAVKRTKNLKGELELIITNNQEIKKINRLWRGINKETDVLAFEWNKNEFYPSEQMGQIFISFPKILSQAKEFNVSSTEEFLRIFIHGLLHLAGYNHHNKNEAQKMFKIQEQILTDTINKI